MSNAEEAKQGQPEAEETTPQEETEAPAAEQTTAEESGEKTVPVSALQRERKQAKGRISELEEKLAELEKAEEERKREELSEVEKAKLEADEAKQALQNAKAELTVERRKQVALAAATKAGFKNPEDALSFLDLSETNEEDIPEKVSELLEQKEYLKADQPGPSQTSGIDSGSKPGDEASDTMSATAAVFQDAKRLIGG